MRILLILLITCQLTTAFRWYPAFQTRQVQNVIFTSPQRRSNDRYTKLYLSTDNEETEETEELLPFDNSPPDTGINKLVVTGIENEEDESSLQILMEDKNWNSIHIGGTNIDELKRKLLSRTSKYSGLYDILTFQSTDLTNPQQVETLLQDASAWIAFGLNRTLVPSLAEIAIKQEVPRVVFTVRLTPEEVEIQPGLPEFQEAIALFTKHERFFTGIRHGEVVSGEEHLPYSIVNSSYACETNEVPRGVLGRVAAELLHLQNACNKECGIASSSIYAKTFLEMLRSAGSTPAQEVAFLFDGALQKVIEESFQDEEIREQERLGLLSTSSLNGEYQEVPPEKFPLQRYSEDDKKRILHVEKPKKLENSDVYIYATIEKLSDNDYETLDPTIEPGEENRNELRGVPTGLDAMFGDQKEDPAKERLEIERFLSNIWRAYVTYYGPLPMGRAAFVGKNFYQAKTFLRNIGRMEETERLSYRLRQEATLAKLDSYSQKKAASFSQLVNYRQKQLQKYQSVYDIWVQYMAILLTTTMKEVTQRYARQFNSLTAVQQTMTLRQIANELRKQSNLPESTLIYEPADAEMIVKRLRKKPMYHQIFTDPNLPIGLYKQFGYLFASIPALRGANEKLQSALKTIQHDQISEYKQVKNITSTETKYKKEDVVFIDRRWADDDPNPIVHPLFAKEGNPKREPRDLK